MEARDRAFGYQSPIDGIAEHFVDSHAVLKDGETLWQPEEWRGYEATKLNVILQRIALCLVDENADKIAIHVLTDINTMLSGQLVGRHRLYVGRHFVAIQTGAAQRRDANDFDFVEDLRLFGNCNAHYNNGQKAHQHALPSACFPET